MQETSQANFGSHKRMLLLLSATLSGRSCEFVPLEVGDLVRSEIVLGKVCAASTSDSGVAPAAAGRRTISLSTSVNVIELRVSDEMSVGPQQEESKKRNNFVRVKKPKQPKNQQIKKNNRPNKLKKLH